MAALLERTDVDDDDDGDEDVVVMGRVARWTRARVSIPDRSAEPSPHEAANSKASRMGCIVMCVVVSVVVSGVPSKLVCKAIMLAAARI